MIFWIVAFAIVALLTSVVAYVSAYFTASADKSGKLVFHNIDLEVTTTNEENALFSTSIGKIVPGRTISFADVDVTNSGTASVYALLNLNIHVTRPGYTDVNFNYWYDFSNNEIDVADMLQNTIPAVEIEAGATNSPTLTHKFEGEVYNNSFIGATAKVTLRAVGVQTENLKPIGEDITDEGLIAAYMLVDEFKEDLASNIVDMNVLNTQNVLKCSSPTSTFDDGEGNIVALFNFKLINANPEDIIYVYAHNINDVHDTVFIVVPQNYANVMDSLMDFENGTMPEGTVVGSGRAVANYIVSSEETGFTGQFSVTTGYMNLEEELIIEIYKTPQDDLPELSNNLAYTLLEDETGYSVFLPNIYIAETELTVLDTFNSLPVKEVADYGFNSFMGETIVLGGNIKKIGNSAFVNSAISSITIPSSVTTIGDYAFLSCYQLGGVNFEANSQLTTIGDSAFNSTAITTITIPSSVETIGESVFVGCDALSTVNFEENSQLTTIGDSAFHSIAITTITIPSSVETIGERAFGGCDALTEIVLQTKEGCFWGVYYDETFKHEADSLSMNDLISYAKVGYFKQISYNDVLIFTLSSDGTYYIVSGLKDNTTLSKIIISAEYQGKPVKEIGYTAFDYEAITTITIPSSVTTIGREAFNDCSQLSTVNFEENSQLTTIGDSAFDSTAVTTITIPSSVETIGERAFYSCSQLSTVNFEANSQLTTIGDSAFYSTAITTITIPSSVTTIGVSAFSNCAALATVNFEANSQLTTIERLVFYNCDSLIEITIPSSVETIGERAFYGCDALTEIILNEKDGYVWEIYNFSNSLVEEDANELEQSVLIIYAKGSYYFKQVPYNPLNFTLSDGGTYYIVSGVKDNTLSGVTIPAEYQGKPVKEIGEQAFYECSDLTTVAFESGSQITTIGASAFESCTSLSSITLPNTLTTVGDMAFAMCGSLTSISLPGSVTSIGMGAFVGSGLETISIPNGVTSIEMGTFMYCANLTSVLIPSSVTIIGESAFEECAILGSVSIGANSNLQTIGNRAFYNCATLGSISIPNGVTSIGEMAFGTCSNLSTVTFGVNSRLTEIKLGAFIYCTNLSSITIPNSVTTIGGGAFGDCESLTSITIPSGVLELELLTFAGCNNLTSLTLQTKYEYCWTIYDKDLMRIMLIDASDLTEEQLASYAQVCTLTQHKIEQDGDVYYATQDGETYYILKDNTEAETITVPSQFNGKPVVGIGDCAYSFNSNLTSIVIPNYITFIGEGAFSSCQALTEIILQAKTDYKWQVYVREEWIDCSTLTPAQILESSKVHQFQQVAI